MSRTVILAKVFGKGFGNKSLFFVTQAQRKACLGVLTQPAQHGSTADRTSTSRFYPRNFSSSWHINATVEPWQTGCRYFLFLDIVIMTNEDVHQNYDQKKMFTIDLLGIFEGSTFQQQVFRTQRPKHKRRYNSTSLKER